MGPRLMSRGKPAFQTDKGKAFLGFNGAAAHEPRKGAIPTMYNDPWLSFNGAAAHEPRKGG